MIDGIGRHTSEDSNVLTARISSDDPPTENTDENGALQNKRTIRTDDEEDLSSSSKRQIRDKPVWKTYGLRPRTGIKILTDDLEVQEQEAQPRGKIRVRVRTGSVSKYRRRTANARERSRMREINKAFSTLRGILPTLSSKRSSAPSLTKIRTLRLAASYIKALSDLLNNPENHQTSEELSGLLCKFKTEEPDCSSASGKTNMWTTKESTQLYTSTEVRQHSSSATLTYSGSFETFQSSISNESNDGAFDKKTFQPNLDNDISKLLNENSAISVKDSQTLEPLPPFHEVCWSLQSVI